MKRTNLLTLQYKKPEVIAALHTSLLVAILINAAVFFSVDNLSLKVFINVLIFYVLNLGAILVTKRSHKDNRTILLLGLGVAKLVAILILLLAFNNPMKPHNHIPALLICANYFVFQTAIVFDAHKSDNRSK